MIRIEKEKIVVKRSFTQLSLFVSFELNGWLFIVYQIVQIPINRADKQLQQNMQLFKSTLLNWSQSLYLYKYSFSLEI